MRLFVTGGAGFIGSNYVRRVLAQGDEVTVYDALTYAGNLSTLEDVAGNAQYTFVNGDVCDLPSLQEAMKGHDAVVHFAAETHVDNSISGPVAFINTNCLGTNQVMDAARRLEIDNVIHISTDETYGSIDSGSFTEKDRLTPRSPYSASKAGSDMIALSYHTTYGVPVTVTRASNNFGPFQYPEKVIPLFVTNLIQGKKVPLYGDGLNVRDWIYVDDHCAAVDLILREGKVGEIYNIGGGNEITNLDLTNRILDLMDADESMIEQVADRLGHDRRYSVDCTKLRELGWKPERDLETALAVTVGWYKKNEAWWRPLAERHAARQAARPGSTTGGA